MAEENRLQCTYPSCSKVFYSRSNMLRHIRQLHLGMSNFVCEVCGKSLSSRQAKNDHVNTHFGRKPYQCPYEACSKRFTQASQLSSHLRVHRPGPRARNLRPPSALPFLELPPLDWDRLSLGF